MQAEKIIEQVESRGGKLVLIHGKLKGCGFDSDTRALVRKFKTELIELLREKTVEPGKPFITGGELRIPMDCNPQYRWCEEGHPIFDTLIKLGASDDLVESFIGPISNPSEWRRWEQIKESRRKA